MTEQRERILVIDDEEMVRSLLQRTLEKAGYDIITAANGQEGLDKMSQFDVNLILLDITMPVLDGFQTLELIRQQCNVPVIMVSGTGEVTTVRDTLALGADDYIRKPFKTLELVARIKAKLRRAETAS